MPRCLPPGSPSDEPGSAGSSDTELASPNISPAEPVESSLGVARKRRCTAGQRLGARADAGPSQLISLRPKKPPDPLAAICPVWGCGKHKGHVGAHRKGFCPPPAVEGAGAAAAGQL